MSSYMTDTKKKIIRTKVVVNLMENIFRSRYFFLNAFFREEGLRQVDFKGLLGS